MQQTKKHWYQKNNFNLLKRKINFKKITKKKPSILPKNTLRIIKQMGLFDYIMPLKYQVYLSTQQDIDSRVAPKDLIKELSDDSNMKKFLKALHKPTTNPIKIIRRLHICNLLLLYSNLLTQPNLPESILPLPLTTDKWLNDEFITPYCSFLQKCMNSHQTFSKCTKSLIDEKLIFDQLFFIINLLKLLFKSIQKVALIGKFYKNKNSITWQGVIQMIAIQAKQLYFTFKNILVLILQDTEKFLFTQELQKIMKNILVEDLALINQDMKVLLLGKQFFPYGKGIGIKLFRIDDATQQLENTMRGIVTDHCETNRRLQKEWMEDKLFDKKRGFNIKFFEETLRGTAQSQQLFKAFGKKKSSTIKPASQEIVLSDDDEDPQENHKKLADTNESNLNKVDNV